MPPQAPPHTEAEMQAKKLHRRNYCKNMKKIYREEAKQERVYLLDKLGELERTVTALRQSNIHRSAACNPPDHSMLAWKDIALGLRDDKITSKLKNQQLKRQLAALNKVVYDMKSWAVTNSTLQFALDGFAPTWQNHTLLSNPKSRELGKAWITQHMYHQVDRIFHVHGFPSPDDVGASYFNISVGFPDYRNSVSHQLVFELPMHILATMYQRHFCEVSMMDTPFEDARVGRLRHAFNSIRETSDSTLLHHATRPTANACGDVTNILVGAVKEPGRTLILSQHITDDETLAMHPDSMQRQWSSWMDLRAVTPTTTSVRYITSFSRAWRGNCPTQLLPLAEEGVLVWGMDEDAATHLDASTHEAKVLRNIRTSMHDMVALSAHRIPTIIERYMRQDAGVADKPRESV